MKILRNILIVLGVLVAVALIAAAVLPKSFQMERSIVVDARPSDVYPFVKSFEKRGEWYPWYRKDPEMERSLEGTDGEEGAISRWSGDPETVGSGEQKLVRLVENERVETEIQFTEPMQSEATSFVDLEEENGKTRVTWGFDTRFPFPSNLLLPIIKSSLETEVGKDYEQGLQTLKEISEQAARTYNGYEIQTRDLPERHFVALRRRVGFDQMQGFLERAYSRINKALAAEGVEPAGMPCGMYYTWEEEAEATDMAAAIPVASAAVTLPSSLQTVTLPAGKCLVVDHYGDYDTLGDAHEAMDAYLKDRGLSVSVPIYEQYVTDPGEEPDPSQWLTRIYYQLEN